MTTLNEIRSFLFNNWERYFRSKPKLSDCVFGLIKGRHKQIFQLFISSEPTIVIKISENAEDDHRLIREFKSLLRLHKMYLGIEVPLPFDLVILNGKRILIESALVGTPMTSQIFPQESKNYKTSIERNFNLALNWLLDFHKKTSFKGAFNDSNVKDIKSYYFPHIKPLCDFSYFHGVGSEDTFFKIIKTMDFQTVFSHGDFNPDNILLEKETVRVLDWEESYYPGLPLLDLLNFSLCFHVTTTIIGKARFRLPTYEDFIHVFSKDTFLGEVVMRYYYRYCEELVISSDVQRVIFSLFMVMHLSKEEITQILNGDNLFIKVKAG